MFRKNVFWKTVPVLWNYRKLLATAMGGALLSALCFGAGIGMVLPLFEVLFQKNARPLSDRITELAAKPGVPTILADAGTWIAQYIPDDRFKTFLCIVLVVAVLSVVGSVGRYIHTLLVLTAVNRAIMDWRSRLFRRLIHAPMADVLVRGNADHITRIIADTSLLASGYRAIFGRTVHALSNGLMALLAAFLLNWRLTLIVLIGVPVIAVALRKFGKAIRRATRKSLAERGKLLGMLSEALNGIRVVKVYGGEGYERSRFQTINRRLFDKEMDMRRAKALSSPVIETMALLGVMVVATVAAALIVYRDEESTEMMAVLLALAAAANALKPLTELNNDLNSAGAAAARILETMHSPVEPAGPHTDPKSPKLARHTREVVFEQVEFRYPSQDEPALKGVSLEVQHGMNVAIVGGNGSGKTTLLSMVPRLILPTAGRVLIDGVDIAEVNLRSLREQMAVVTQQSVLFEGTIAENIAYGGSRGADRERIVAAAKAAHADEFVDKLPDGYDYRLGEGGEGLSGGQRQRLCIARAILREPAILILDEATSQIDADSEAKINAALSEFRQGRTTFVIAHRLSTVVDADLIVVMDQGRIADKGSHQELLERCEIYQTLTKTQL